MTKPDSPDSLPQARPLSPHLQVYNMFAITSLTSILHRMTGAALTIGSLLVVAWLLALSHGEEPYTRFMGLLRHPVGQLVLIGFSWAFWYHFFNGLRHLTWDTGRGMNIHVARLTGKLGIIASIAATTAMWCYIYKGL